MSAVLSMKNAAPRSMFEERPLRPPTIGKIRPGIKVLKQAAAKNERAQEIYDQLVAKGESFETIETVIERTCKINTPLVPKNVDYFTVRRSDFTNPDVADEILRLYGEDRGQGLKLYKFPVVFAFNDWLENAPHQLTTWGQSGRKFFSAYEGGVRTCKAYAPVQRDARAQRVIRNLGPRLEIHRQDDAIPDGVCNTSACPEFQAGQCKLNASILFAIPEIKGLGLIELVTTSMYGVGKAREAMEMFSHVNGRLAGNVLWISKKLLDISRQDPKSGQYVRSAQWIPLINADVDISEDLVNPAQTVVALRDRRSDNVIDMAEARAGTGGGHDAEDHADPDDPSVKVGEVDMSAPLVSDAELGEEGAAESQDPPAAEVTSQAVASAAAQAGTEPEPSIDPAVAADPSFVQETVRDKAARLTSLLRQHGVTTQERKELFSKYSTNLLGEGWWNYMKELDDMNNRLMEGLANKQAFEEMMKKEVAEIGKYV